MVAMHWMATINIAGLALRRGIAFAGLVAACSIGVASVTTTVVATDAARGDYAVGKSSHPTQSVVPKSIYLTPKSDRLHTSKGNRFEVAPALEALAPDEPAQDAQLPEITFPFDPHTIIPAQVAGPLPRTKPPIKIHGRPIDITMRNGRLVLNRFHTLSLQMPHDECRKFPRFITADYDLPRSAIDTLADNLMIVQKRICAENGSVVVTCYLNEADISLRRARPDDGCRE